MVSSKYEILDDIKVPKGLIERWQETLDVLAEAIFLPAPTC